MSKKILKCLKIFVTIIMVIIIIYSAIMIAQKIIWRDRIPEIFGYKNFIVLSGSMEPTINIGDIIFIKEVEDVEEGDIISYKLKNSIVTHRVVEKIPDNGKNLYVTQGDANSTEDSEIITDENIEGKYVFKIGKIGNIVLFLKTKAGMIVVIMCFIGMVLIGNRKNKIDKGKHSL